MKQNAFRGRFLRPFNLSELLGILITSKPVNEHQLSLLCIRSSFRKGNCSKHVVQSDPFRPPADIILHQKHLCAIIEPASPRHKAWQTHSGCNPDVDMSAWKAVILSSLNLTWHLSAISMTRRWTGTGDSYTYLCYLKVNHSSWIIMRSYLQAFCSHIHAKRPRISS